MKWLRAYLLIAILIFIFVPMGTASALSPSIDDVKVFQNYQQTGDWLIVVTYNISCNNASMPYNQLSYQWWVQLINNNNPTAPYVQYKVPNCGMAPYGLYVNASLAASPLVWGNSNYSIRVIGQYGVFPNSSRAINTSDWIGDNHGALDSWVIDTANTIQTYNSITYLTTSADNKQILNTDGGTIFGGISGLNVYSPYLFQVTTITVPITYVASTTNTSYADSLYTAPISGTLGAPIANSLSSMGTYFGINARMMCAILILIGFFSIAIIEKSIAFMIILGGVLIGAFPMGTILVLVFLMIVLLVRSLFWSST